MSSSPHLFQLVARGYIGIVCNRSLREVDTTANPENKFSTCRVNSEAKSFLLPSETPTVHVAASRNAEVGFGSAHISLVDQTLQVCNTADSCSSPEVPVSRDPLTCEESAISNAVGDFHVKNGRMETEVMIYILHPK